MHTHMRCRAEERVRKQDKVRKQAEAELAKLS